MHERERERDREGRRKEHLAFRKDGLRFIGLVKLQRVSRGCLQFSWLQAARVIVVGHCHSCH